MRSATMENLYEDEALGGSNSPDPDPALAQPPRHFNGGSGKSVSLRILSMPSSPLPAASTGRPQHSPVNTVPSSPVSAVSLSVATGRDETRRRSGRDRAVRKSTAKLLHTVSAGGTNEAPVGACVATANSAPSGVVVPDDGCPELASPSATVTPAAILPAGVPKKSRVDFVRFDSTEIHYTENEEVRKKISDEIKSITSVVQGQLHQVSVIRSGHYKIENVLDSTLKDALASIAQNAWSVNHLDLSVNALSKIDNSDLSQFPNLKVLNLSSNVLTETVDLSQLQQLQTLDLNGNFIKRLVVGRSVQNLIAVNNHITGVDCVNNAVPNKRINLASNKINWLRDIASTCLSGLEELNLEVNNIDEINFDDLYASKDTLKVLNLGFNFIFNMKSARGFTFTSLQVLDLSFNKLAFMSEVLNVARNAKTINLKNNKLVLIDSKLRLSRGTNLDMRGNEFQCNTLESYLDHHPQHTLGSAESCDGKARKGGYCCENLSAPFADRLIALKRKEQSLFIPRDPEQDRRDCERENAERQRRLNHILNQHRTQRNQAIMHEQEKVKLNATKIALEEELSEKTQINNALVELLRETGAELGLPNFSTADTQEAMQKIVAYYEKRNQEEERKQSKAIQDVENSQKKIEKLLEDKATLDKQTAEADKSLATATTKLAELDAQIAELNKYLYAQQQQS